MNLSDFTKRNPPHSSSVLQSKTIGICGTGGLGSNIAVFLARCCIGKLIIVDFDLVEASNLNRQQFFMEHIGLPKVKALTDIISKISPFTIVKAHNVKLTEENAIPILSDCDVIAEAFDKADQKKMLIETVQTQLPRIPVVGGSGMAGLGPANDIATHKFGNLYVCGDLKTEATEEAGLTASRVALCAAHQAHQILRLLLKCQ